MSRLAARLQADPVYKKAGEHFTTPPAWTGDGGYGHYSVAAHAAHGYCRARVKEHDNGYRTPLSGYWNKFKEAYYVMESEHVELGRMTKDGKGLDALVKASSFTYTPAVSDTCQLLIKEYSAEGGVEKQKVQQNELFAIAVQEQVNVLQPLIYGVCQRSCRVISRSFL